MSDDFLLTDVPWDDDEQLFDRSEPASGKHHFGHLRLAVVKVTKAKDKQGRFAGGHHFTLPDIVGGEFDKKDSNGLKMFKTYDLGGREKLYIFVATKEDSEGQEYQIIKAYADRKYTKNDRMTFADFILPAIRETFNDKSLRHKLASDGVYAEWDELPTGEKFTNAAGEENDIAFWGNFTIYENKETLKVASTEFFAQFQNDDVAKDYYPASWAEAFDSMLDWAKVKAEEIKDPKELAVATMLVVDSDGAQVTEYKKGQPAIAIDGNEVQVKKVLAELLEVPEPMISL